MPPFLSTPFILHSVTTSRTSNTHQLVVGMTVHEILHIQGVTSMRQRRPLSPRFFGPYG